MNKASITLLPKIEAPVSISDYRPISVIYTIVKIITKILANRLQGSPSEAYSHQSNDICKGEIDDGILLGSERILIILQCE